MLEVRLLGMFDIKYEKKPVIISSRPSQSLFAYLILHAESSHRREKLAGMLWPDSLEETARENLRHALWRIRKALESASSTRFLHADDLSIRFAGPSDYWLDAAALEHLSENASVDELTAVLAAYHGELLPGFYDDWVVLEREHLYSIFENHMTRLMSLLEAENRWTDILDWGERWIKLGQKPETAYRALMTAHAAKGDMSKVAATYERCVNSLKEYGMEPSEQTRALFQNLKVRKETLAAGSSIPVVEKRKPTVAPTTNLPVPLTSFIGRQNEIDEVTSLLREKRLITLTGSGGVGKTRLAIESANKVLPKFKDGILWVDLGSLADPALVPQAVAQVAGVPEILSLPLIEALAAHFRFKHALLILDNCEHLVLACAQLADYLLSTCANLKILVTSREGLDILGETIWRVPSLSLPEGQVMPVRESLRKFESIQLFIDRAVMIQPTFELTDQNARSITQICRRLSGMPLAIELAAARVKMMSVEEIAQRLDDRFSLLTGGSRTALPRQQTLRATIDWSHDILSEPERILFRCLSVFVGGFTLEAAEAVAAGGHALNAQVIDLLGQLINKSLVTVGVRSEESDVETRYGMLETIRDYALDKLRDAGEEESVRNNHLGYFVKLVEEFEPKLERAEQQLWLDRLESELDNLRSAIDWALASVQTIAALRLVAGLRRFWLIRNHDSEGIERLRAMLSRPDATQPTSARLKALNTYFFLLWAHGKLMDVQVLIEEALALGVRLEDSWNTAFAFLWAGISAAERGDYFNAQVYLRQSRAEWHDAGDATYEALALVFQGENAMLHNDFALAQELFEIALRRLREVKDYPFLGMVLRRLGQLAVSEGDLSLATTLIREALVYNWNIRDYRGTCACFAALADVCAAGGHIQRAARLFGVVESILEFTQIPLLPFDQQEYARNADRLRLQLDGAVFSAPWSEGRAMRLEQAVTFALEDR